MIDCKTGFKTGTAQMAPAARLGLGDQDFPGNFPGNGFADSSNASVIKHKRQRP